MPPNPNFQKNFDRTVARSVERSADLERIEREAIANFSGQSPELTAALGLLRIGDHMGWKILYLMHSKRTIRKYEKILGIQIRDSFPEEGPSAERSMGYKIARKLSNFWKAVSGEVKVENRREISEE